MVLCTIRYNAGTGVSAASGTGRPATAWTQANRSETISAIALSTTLTFSGAVDLTGVADDGTDVVRITGTAGMRHLFRIVSFTGGVSACTAMVVAEAVGATLVSGSDWAIGGVRGNAASGLEQDATRTDLDDAVGGWVYELDGAEGSDGDYPLTVMQQAMDGGSVADGYVYIEAASGATPAFTWAAGNYPFRVAGQVKFKGIKMTGSDSASRCIYTAGGSLVVEDCTLSAGRAIYVSNKTGCVVIASDIVGTTGAGIDIASGARLFVSGSDIHDCGAEGIVSANTTRTSYVIQKTAFHDNVGAGLAFGVNVADCQVAITNCTFDGNGVNGINFLDAATLDSGPFEVTDCVFTRNVGRGINSTSGNLDIVGYFNYNAFGAGTGWANTLGNYNGITPGANDVSFADATDPYTDSAAFDLTLDETNGLPAINAGMGYNG